MELDLADRDLARMLLVARVAIGSASRKLILSAECSGIRTTEQTERLGGVRNRNV
jgi:hypothetical protein